MLPFDGQGLNELLGGDEVMASRLDNHFRKPDGSWVLYRDSAEYADVSNQPSIATPWMYLYTGKAYKTQQTVRETMKQLWHNTVSGIPGQDDLGQMSSWYVFSALGMYPFYPGRADMVLSSPAFEKAKIGNISISAPNASADHIYIDTLAVNGQPSMQSWINENHVNAPPGTLNLPLALRQIKRLAKLKCIVRRHFQHHQQLQLSLLEINPNGQAN